MPNEDEPKIRVLFPKTSEPKSESAPPTPIPRNLFTVSDPRTATVLKFDLVLDQNPDLHGDPSYSKTEFSECRGCKLPVKRPGKYCEACARDRVNMYGQLIPDIKRETKIKIPFVATDVVPATPARAESTILNLPGLKIRHRLEVSTEDLRRENSDVVSVEAFDQARRALLLVNLDDLKFSEVGVSVQEEFAKIADRLLALTTSPALDDMIKGLKEMGEFLSAVDLEILFKEPSTWAKWLGQPPSLDQVKETLRSKIKTVELKSLMLRGSLFQVSNLESNLRGLEKDLASCLIEIETELVVVRFLIGYLLSSPEKRDVSQLHGRADSIAVTRVTLRQAMLQLQLFNRYFDRLTETTRAALINMVPAWCGSCSSFLSSVRPDQARPTAALAPLALFRNNLLQLLLSREK